MPPIPTFGDSFMLALAIWREARGEGTDGMVAVGCVVRNRVNAHSSSYYAEVVKPQQFSSITVKNDPEVNLYPSVVDAQWLTAQKIAVEIMDGILADTTNGAQFYYATTIPLPQWAENMTMTCQIGRQRFYKE